MGRKQYLADIKQDVASIKKDVTDIKYMHGLGLSSKHQSEGLQCVDIIVPLLATDIGPAVVIYLEQHEWTLSYETGQLSQWLCACIRLSQTHACTICILTDNAAYGT